MARRSEDRMASVLRVRRVQQDIAAAARQQAEVAESAATGRFAARRRDVERAWSDRVLVELAFAAVDRAAGSLDEATAVADERRSEHLAAVQRTRGIERLVERRHVEAVREETRRLAATLDDLTTARHHWSDR